jgi:methionine-R-sulfoxide reductase
MTNQRYHFQARIWLAVSVAALLVLRYDAVAQTRTTPPMRGHEMSTFKKPTDAELRQKLSPLQYQVTQHEGTERPFQNEYWNNHEPGIYVDVVSGEPLFSSLDKFESGTGWPSFTKPLVPDNIKTKTDRSLLMARTEVRSSHADSHLGHVFDDGPRPTGLRYCMNSASMRFIPASKLVDEGYGEFAPLFQPAKK